MKSVSKKLLSIVLAVVLMLSVVTVAFASVDKLVKDDGTYSIDGVTGEITNGLLNLTDMDEDTFVPYTEINKNAFRYDDTDPELDNLKGITEVVVAKGIETVGENAFANLPALEKITFKGDIVIDKNAFENCLNLTTVIFEGDAVIGDSAFAGCTSLETIEIKDDAEFSVATGALNDTKWFSDFTVDFVMLGTTLIAYTGKDTEETIPLNVTDIADGAFEGNSTLKKIVITKYVETIGSKAFANCSALEEVVYSDYGEIKEVGSDAFMNTPYFDNFEGDFFTVGSILIKYVGKDKSFVLIPNSITEIADNAFDGCYASYTPDGYTFVITAIAVPASVTEFGENCFALAKLDNGEYYCPRIYAYEGTDALKALQEAGYLVSPMNKLADVNNDGKIDAADARLALRIAVKLDLVSPIVYNAADVDGDGVVTAADARIILRIAVGLEDYNAEDLLYMPRSDFEVLQAYTTAMKTIAIYNAGYTKTEKTDINVKDSTHKSRLSGLVGISSYNGKANVYAPDTQAALDNINFCSLLNTDIIKSTSCKCEDGKYTITITFNNVVDADLDYDSHDYTASTPLLSKVMPLVSGESFYNAFVANKSTLLGPQWFTNWLPDNDGTSGTANELNPNCVRYYHMEYQNPTVTIVVDKDTFKAESAKLTVNYNFAVDGRINGVDVSSSGFKKGDGLFNRVDTIEYTDFVY